MSFPHVWLDVIHVACCRIVKNIDPYPAILDPFPNTTILQQTTFNIFCQKIENLYNWIDNLWLKQENIVAKGEIACFEQFLLLSLCFQKVVCCRGVRKHIHCIWGKGLNNVMSNDKSAADNFENIKVKICEISVNKSMIIEWCGNIVATKKFAQNMCSHIMDCLISTSACPLIIFNDLLVISITCLRAKSYN